MLPVIGLILTLIAVCALVVATHGLEALLTLGAVWLIVSAPAFLVVLMLLAGGGAGEGE